MDNNGFFRVAAVVPTVDVANVDANTKHIIDGAKLAAQRGARLIVFPEMSVTGYTCADLFHNSTLIQAASDAIDEIAAATADIPALILVGAPVIRDGRQYNCAVAIANGGVVAIIPKTYLPNYNEFYEKRWWHPGENNTIIRIGEVKIAVEICEDLWSPIPPSSRAAIAGAQIIANLSASDDLIGKYSYLTRLIQGQSARCIAGYVYCGAGYGESSTDLVFDGKGFIAENGYMLARNQRWQSGTQMVIADIDIEAINRERLHNTTFGDAGAMECPINFSVIDVKLPQAAPNDDLLRDVNPRPFVPPVEEMDERCSEIINIQVAGLARRLDATHTRKLVVGISGGLDSTLALLVAAKTFDRLNLDRKGIIGVTMPGFGTTGRTYNNALTLMRSLGITIREIPIADAVKQHFSDIGHNIDDHDVTYENSQARERTQILMDIANKEWGMVLGTGDLSEFALGWATYNGDHMSMYGVNAGVPKTLVKYLVNWFAINTTDPTERAALLDIIDTPISPELLPADDKGEIDQKTEDLVGPYDLHDFFLYYTLRYGFTPKRIFTLARKAFGDEYDDVTILRWMRVFFKRFFSQQFKRSCMPDGPKVGSVCLSPRGDWRMPSDASSAIWLKEIEQIEQTI